MFHRHHKKLYLTLIVLIAFSACLLTGCTANNENVYFGSDFSLEISGGGAFSNAKKIDKALENLENTLSAGLMTSDVGRINSAEVGVPVSIGEDFAYLYNLCLSFYGQFPSFSPFVFPLVELWRFDPVGYTLNPKSIPSGEEITAIMDICKADSFYFDAAKMTVTKLKAGAKLDFGQSAKGYAADIAANIAGKSKYVVNVGGTIRTNKKISVAIASPTSDGYAASLILDNNAVATSGNYERYYIYEGVRYHHIIGADGYPAGIFLENPIISATVVGPEAVICDALSTLVFIEGTKCEEILNKLGYSALILTKDTYKTIGDVRFEIIESRQAA